MYMYMCIYDTYTHTKCVHYSKSLLHDIYTHAKCIHYSKSLLHDIYTHVNCIHYRKSLLHVVVSDCLLSQTQTKNVISALQLIFPLEKREMRLQRTHFQHKIPVRKVWKWHFDREYFLLVFICNSREVIGLKAYWWLHQRLLIMQKKYPRE